VDDPVRIVGGYGDDLEESSVPVSSDDQQAVLADVGVVDAVSACGFPDLHTVKTTFTGLQRQGDLYAWAPREDTLPEFSSES
jgi:hypothetical protein